MSQYVVNNPLTFTNLVALANNTRADSAVIDNTTTQFDTFDVSIRFKLNSGGVIPTNNVIIGVVRSNDGGLTYESGIEAILNITGLTNSEEKTFGFRINSPSAFFKVSVRNNSGASFDANPLNFSSVYTGIRNGDGGVTGTIGSGSVSVGTSATLIRPANTSRHGLVLTNAGGATVFIGPAGVTTANGLAVPNNTTLNLPNFSGNALFGIVTAGTNTVSVLEW